MGHVTPRSSAPAGPQGETSLSRARNRRERARATPRFRHCALGAPRVATGGVGDFRRFRAWAR
eukprot:6578041-Alexandrium_andersonii.AAC.1